MPRRLDERSCQQIGKRLLSAAEMRDGARQFGRQANGAARAIQDLATPFGGPQCIAHGREVAWIATAECQTRRRARDIRRPLESFAQELARLRLGKQKGYGVEACPDFGGVAQRTCKTVRQLARAGTGYRTIDGREQAPLALAARRAEQLQAV